MTHPSEGNGEEGINMPAQISLLVTGIHRLRHLRQTTLYFGRRQRLTTLITPSTLYRFAYSCESRTIPPLLTPYCVPLDTPSPLELFMSTPFVGENSSAAEEATQRMRTLPGPCCLTVRTISGVSSSVSKNGARVFDPVCSSYPCFVLLLAGGSIVPALFHSASSLSSFFKNVSAAVRTLSRSSRSTSMKSNEPLECGTAFWISDIAASPRDLARLAVYTFALRG